MAEPDIKVLVGVEGGGSIDGESGKLILKELTEVANQINKDKTLQVAINVNFKETKNRFEQQLKSALKHIKLDMATVIDLSNGDKTLLSIGANVKTSLSNLVKESQKKVAEINTALANMGGKDFNPFKDMRNNLNREVNAINSKLSSVRDINEINKIHAQLERVFNDVTKIQNAVSTKNALKVQAEEIKKSLGEIETDGFDSIAKQVRTAEEAVDSLVKKLANMKGADAIKNAKEQMALLKEQVKQIENNRYEAGKIVADKGLLSDGIKTTKTFADGIGGEAFDTVKPRIEEIKNELDLLKKELETVDDSDSVLNLSRRFEDLKQELLELRQQANPNFDFNLEKTKADIIAKYEQKRAESMSKKIEYVEDIGEIDRITKAISKIKSEINQVGTADGFSKQREELDRLVRELDEIEFKPWFEKMQSGGFASFNKDLTAAKSLMENIGSSRYSGVLDILNDQESAQLKEAENIIRGLMSKHGSQVSFSGYGELVTDSNELIKALVTLQNIHKNLNTTYRNSNWAMQERQNFNVLTNSVQRYYDTYKDNISKIPSLNASFSNLLSRLEMPSNFKGGIKEARIEFSNLRREFQLTGGESQTLMQRLQALFGTRLGSAAIGAAVMALRNGLRQTVKHVVDINTSMTELRKVSNSSADALGEFFDRTREKAVDLSTEITTLVDATANFSRLGYGLQEAETLGEWATILANVADGMDSIDDATNSMISTMAAFGIEADKANEVVDKFNKIGNEYPISTAGAAEALKRSASALSEASNTIDESLALIATANSVVQNPESVGTTLKTLSLRMRSAKVELEEAGEESEGAAESVADLRKEILALTNQRVDIMIDDDTFKSTYKMLEEISAVWNDINDVDRAALLELIAGKRNANVAAAIINNFDMAKEALEGSINAEGSAMREYEVWMDSIQAKTQQFTAQFQSLSGVLVEQDWIKDVVDMGTDLLKLLTALVEKTGSIPILVTALSTLATLKNVGWARVIPDFDSNKYTLNTQKLTEAIQDLYWGYKSIAEVGGEAAQGLKEGFARAILGKAPGITALWGDDRQGLFDSVVNGLKNAQFSGTQDAVDTFWKSLGANTSISENSAKALRAYFDTVDTGEASLKGFNEFIPKFNAGLEETHRVSKKSQIAMSIWSGVINGAVSLAITGIIALISNWITSQKKLIQEGHDLVDAYTENVNSINDSINKLQKNRSEFEMLSKGVGDSGENIALSADQYERYVNLANEIAELSPELVKGYDAEGNAIIAKNNAIDQTIAKLKEEIALEKAKLLVNKDAVDAAFRYDYRNIDVVGALETLRGSQGSLNLYQTELGLIRKDLLHDPENEDLLAKENELLLNIQEAQAQINIDEAYYQGLLRQREALVEDYYNNYGSAWVTLNKDYQEMSAPKQALVNSLASYINPTEVEDYEKALLHVVNSVNDKITAEQANIINNLSNQNSEHSYLEYMKKTESLIKTLPADIQHLVGEMSGFNAKSMEAIDLVGRFRSEFGLIGFGEEYISGTSTQAKTAVEKYLETLSSDDLKLIINAGIEIDRNTSADYIEKQLDQLRSKFSTDEPIYIPFSFSDYSGSVDGIKTNAETLAGALQKLDDGELQKSDLWELMTKFPALVDYIDASAEGFGNLREGLLLTMSGLDDALMAELDTKISNIQAEIDRIVGEVEGLSPDNAVGSMDYLLADNSVLSGLNDDLHAAEESKDVLSDVTEAAENTVSTLKRLKTAYLTLTSVVNEYNSNGSISVDTFESLLDVEDKYLAYLEVTEEGVILNTEALQRQLKVEMELKAYKRAEQLVSNAQAAIENGVAETFLAESIDLVTTASWDSLKALAASEEMQKNFGTAIVDIVNNIQNSLNEIDWSSFGGSSGSTDPWKDEFESYLSELEFMRDTNKISEQQYYTELNRLNEKYFANNKKYLDDYRKYYVEVYDYLLKRQEDMLNAIGDAAQKALDKQLKAKDDEIAARQELIDAKREELNALEEQYEKEDRLFELQKARDNYNKIAANKNTRLYTRDKGWIYTADPHALQEAKDKLDELEKENKRAEAKEAIEDEIKALEDEIKVIEKEKEAIEALKDKWSEATDNIGKSLDEYMLDMQLTTEFTKMSYDQMSKAVLQYAMLTKAAMGGKLLGNGFAGFENIYGATSVNPLMYTATPAPIIGGANTGATNVVEEETNRPTGAGATGIKAYIASKSSNTAQPTNRDEDKMLKIQTDTEKNTSNSYETSIQLFRLGEDTFMMEEDAFAEQYDLTNALYNTTLEDLENAYDTNEGVWSLYELLTEMMENGIKTQGGGFGGGSGIRGFIESGGLEDGDSESTGAKGARSRKRIYYEDMTDEQKARAEKMAYKYDIPVEEIRMYDILSDQGTIIMGGDQLNTEDRQMVAKNWADSVHDLTEEMYREYRRPWTEEELRAQEAAKIVMGSRARGSMSIGRSGLYNVDEQGTETIIRPQNGRVTWLEQGDKVYTAPNTKRNYDMTDLFERVDSLELLKRNIFDNPIEKLVSNINGLSQPKTTQAIPIISKGVERSNDIYISGCDFNMPNVTDRESFIRDLTRIAKYK